MRDEQPLGVILLLVLATAWLIWLSEGQRKDRFRECMNVKHDKYICEPYSRRGRQ